MLFLSSMLFTHNTDSLSRCPNALCTVCRPVLCVDGRTKNGSHCLRVVVVVSVLGSVSSRGPATHSRFAQNGSQRANPTLAAQQPTTRHTAALFAPPPPVCFPAFSWLTTAGVAARSSMAPTSNLTGISLTFFSCWLAFLLLCAGSPLYILQHSGVQHRQVTAPRRPKIFFSVLF